MRRNMKISGVMIGASDVHELAAFYTKVLGPSSFHDGDWYFWHNGGSIMIGPHSEVHGKNEHPQRMMIMLEVDDVKATFDELKGIGADAVAEPYRPQEGEENFWLATLADPEGNYFQLASPNEM
jgi:predicted enzyme related to lactoylglutathione lyase